MTVEAALRCYCGGTLAPDRAASNRELAVWRCVDCDYRRSVYRHAADRSVLQQSHPSALHDAGGERFGLWASVLRARFARLRARRIAATGATRILDFGCGQGYLLDALRSSGIDACGVEISDLTARRARSRGHRVEPSHDRFEDRAFDTIVSVHVLEHLPDPERVLTELRRVLRAGAWFQFEVPNGSSWQARLFGARWLHFEGGLHVHQFTRRSFEALLARSGYSVARRASSSLEHGLFGWIQSIFNLALPYNRFFRTVVLARSWRERLACWPELLLLPIVAAVCIPLWAAETLACRGAVLRFDGRLDG